MRHDLKPHLRFPWKENWNKFNWLKMFQKPPKRKKSEKEKLGIVDYIFKEYLQGGRSLKVLGLLSPLTFKPFAEGLCNHEAQFEAGYPLPLKPMGFNCEPIFDPILSARSKPMQRVYRYFIPYDELKNGWNPDSVEVVELKRQVNETFSNMKETYRFIHQKEMNYDDPNSPEFWRFIEDIASERIAKGRRPFDMILSGPNVHWIGRRLRETAGELSFPNTKGLVTSTGAIKRELHEIKVCGYPHCLTYGFAWGLHPIGPEGNEFSYTMYAGKDVISQMVRDRLTKARCALMGLGPTTMDDPELLDVAGPSSDIGIEYPGRNRKKSEFHNEGLALAKWIPEQVPLCMFGDGTDRRNLGDAIAGRILVLYHAYLMDLTA